MEENEGKDLAKDMKEEVVLQEEYYENVKLELEKIVLSNVTLAEKHIQREEKGKEIVTYDIYIKFKEEDVVIASIDENGKLIPNEALLKDEKYTSEEQRKLGDMINLLGLQKEEVDLQKLQEQLREIEAKTKEELKKDETEEEKDEETNKDDKEKEDNEEVDKEEESEKQEVAKQYKVNTKDVVHLNTKGEKITEDKDFAGLVKWAEGREDIYIIANRYGEIDKVVEKKDGKFSEIEADLPKVHGNNPNITIQRIGKDKITEEKPLKIHQLDSRTALATVRNEWGELETLYCRKQEGEQKYWGSVIPENAGKNVRQLEYKERSFMDPKNTSSMDLADKEDELLKAQDLEDRGVPSKEKGIQTYEINGNTDQNREVAKEDIVEDLMKRDGIIDKLTVPPGYYENKAEKVLQLIENNKDIRYEQAVKQVERAEEREERRNNSRRK